MPILLFAAAVQPYDLVIHNGHIIDGTGSPWYSADVGTRGGKIAAIGHLRDIGDMTRQLAAEWSS